MEFALCITGMHPGQEDGSKGIPTNDGKAQVLGRDSDHLADPLWRTLAYPGAFWVIRDEQSGEVRPLEVSRKNHRIRQKDLKRRREWMPAPPILSPDQLDGEPVWTHRGRGLPKQIRLKSGWEVLFATNEGKVKQGNRIHLAWFDEEVSSAHWYRETMRGLMDWDGIFWWSATPQTGSVALYDLHQKALEGDSGVEEFFLHIKDNPYITPEAKEEFYNSLLTEEDRSVAWHGNYLMTGLIVYPELDCEKEDGVHYCRWEKENPPLEWMKVIATDPGYRASASLFGALSPDGELHIYDELYLKGKSAKQWAPEVSAKLCRQTGYQEQPNKHVFDYQGGRITEMASGQTVMSQYMDELARVGVRHHGNTGPYFSKGQKDVMARTESTKNLLAPDNRGRIKVRIDPHRCPNLVREMKLQRWKQGTGREKRELVENHLVDCFEYLCAYPLRYIHPIVRGLSAEDMDKNPILLALEEKRKRQRGVPGALSLREVMRLQSPLNEEEYSDAYSHPRDRD